MVYNYKSMKVKCQLIKDKKFTIIPPDCIIVYLKGKLL